MTTREVTGYGHRFNLLADDWRTCLDCGKDVTEPLCAANHPALAAFSDRLVEWERRVLAEMERT